MELNCVRGDQGKLCCYQILQKQICEVGKPTMCRNDKRNNRPKESQQQISNGGSWAILTVTPKLWCFGTITFPGTRSSPLHLLVLPHGGRLSLWHAFNGIHQLLHQQPEKIKPKLALPPLTQERTLAQIFPKYHRNCNTHRGSSHRGHDQHCPCLSKECFQFYLLATEQDLAHWVMGYLESAR